MKLENIVDVGRYANSMVYEYGEFRGALLLSCAMREEDLSSFDGGWDVWTDEFVWGNMRHSLESAGLDDDALYEYVYSNTPDKWPDIDAICRRKPTRESNFTCVVRRFVVDADEEIRSLGIRLLQYV